MQPEPIQQPCTLPAVEAWGSPTMMVFYPARSGSSQAVAGNEPSGAPPLTRACGFIRKQAPELASRLRMHPHTRV